LYGFGGVAGGASELHQTLQGLRCLRTRLSAMPSADIGRG
jgi:hypothetical protein